MSLNLHLFDTWTEESTYYLGVMSVLIDDEFNIKAPDADRNWLRRVAKIIGVLTIPTNNTFSMNHPKLVEKLYALQKKHGNPINAVPEESFSDYVRGVWDASGAVSAKGITMAGRMKALLLMRERLYEMGVISNKAAVDNDSDDPDALPLLHIPAEDTEHLAKWMYKGSPELFLPAKREMLLVDAAAPPAAEQKEQEVKEDEPRKLRGTGSERPPSTRRSSPRLRTRIRREPDFDSLVW